RLPGARSQRRCLGSAGATRRGAVPRLGQCRDPQPRGRAGDSAAAARLDEVAYLRFASVYRDFESLADFEAEIAALRADRGGQTDVQHGAEPDDDARPDSTLTVAEQ